MPITTCDSPETLRAEIDTVRKKVTLDETEDTWDTIAQGILHLTRLCNNGGCEFPSEMVAGIRSISRPLNNALNSERSRLSGAAVEFLTALATGLGPSLDPLVSQFVPALLVLCGRTNKVFTSRAKACILAIIQHTRLPSLLPYLAELANHKSVFSRLTAAEGILACLNCFNPPDLEKESRARAVEDFIKLTARDASADVRKASKDVFKAYKTLLPARVDSFVAPLTPVVKKYLDIQTGPSGIHGTSSNAGQKQFQISRPSSRANNKVAEVGPRPASSSGVRGISSNTGQKQISRPSSRANNKVMEVGQRPASSTLPKPPTHPATDGLVQSTGQRSVVRNYPTAVDIRAPRQRTTSQMQRDPTQSRGFHINAQSSSAAQRCAVPTSAPARSVVQRPQPGVAEVLPARNPPSAGGPQRLPTMQIKFNPPPDRLKVAGNGAKRIPLPSVPANGDNSEQVTATANSADRAGSTSDQPRPKPSARNVEATEPGRMGIGRKVPGSTQSASSSTKPANGLATTKPSTVQRSHKPPVKGEINHVSGIVPQRRPARDVKKGTHAPVKAERKETSPTLIPLPPSPSTPPTEVPLPPSPDCTLHPTRPEAQDGPIGVTSSDSSDPAGKQLGTAEPCQEQGDVEPPSTPITALLSSIQRGFLFTPSSPLSPPQNYLPALGDFNLKEKRQDTIAASGPLLGAPFCVLPEDDSAVDGSDRHALRDLN